MKRILSAVLSAACLAIAFTATAQTAIKMTLPNPPDFGKVIIGNYSEKYGLARAEFDHWLHRAKFTCRVCHVDIGFALKGGATGITAADNMRGYYCGACHKPKGIAFESCSKPGEAVDRRKCERCHSQGGNGTRTYEYKSFTEKFPKERYGKGVNWERTEELGLIKLADFVEGVSMKRRAMPLQRDLEMKPEDEKIPDIIFSHRKHVVWSGCEGCHPDLFSVMTKAAAYDMDDMFAGQYCGACHGKVAFHLMDCNRCHKKPMY